MKKRLSLFTAILVLLSVMLAAPVSGGAYSEDAEKITVYFENNWLWTDVFYHTWGSSLTDTNTNWGGGIPQKVGTSVNGYDVYKAVVGSDAMGVIFAGTKNDGTDQEDQTPNIEESDIFEGACYSMLWEDGNSVTVSYITDVCPNMREDITTDPTEAPADTTPEESLPTDPTEAPVDDTVTIYFENNWKWEDAKIYWYGNTTGEQLQWPGTVMTYYETNENGNDIYVVEVPYDIQGIVFNGGGEQSEDVLIGWADGVCYFMVWDDVTQTKSAVAYDYKVEKPEETDPVETTVATEPTEATEPEETTAPTEATEPEATYVVYYVDSGFFDKVYANAWSEDQDPDASWPGVPMTLTDIQSPDGSPVYSFTADRMFDYIVFNNGSDMCTEELTFTPDSYLWWTDEVWYEDINDILYEEDNNPEDDGLPDGTAKLAGYTIGLGGRITINYSYILSDDVANKKDSRVVFTVTEADGDIRYHEILVEDAEFNGTYYVFSFEMNAKEMTDKITAQFVSDNVTTEENVYTIKEYAEYILANKAFYAGAQDIVKALLNYGAAAQRYFNYNTDDLANDTEYMTAAEKEIKSCDVSGYEITATGNTATDYFYGATLSLKSETTLKLYYNLNNDLSTQTELEAYVDNDVVTAVRNGSLFEIAIGNIPAHQLSKVYTIKLNDITVKASAFGYVCLAQENTNSLLVDVANALAEYANQATLYNAK